MGLRILRQLNDKRSEAECLHNMGAANFNDGNTELAVKLFDEAFQINRSLKEHRAASVCLNSLKAAYIRLGDALQASQCVQLMQEYFPDQEVQSVAEQLELDMREAEERGDLEAQAELHMKLGVCVCVCTHMHTHTHTCTHIHTMYIYICLYIGT